MHVNGFEKRTNQIKEKILNATRDLLRTSDPKRIRITDISKAAKVSQVTIYNYFGSKEELVRQVFKYYVDKAVQDFTDYMDEGHTLKEKIEHIILLEKESYREFPPGVIKGILAEDKEMAEYIERLYREVSIPMTIRILEEGKASGEISEQVSVENVLSFIQLYMNQLDVMLEMARQSADMDKFLEGMVHLFFYGICGKE